MDVVTRAAEVAHAHGVKVILNPAPAQPLPVSLLALKVTPLDTTAAGDAFVGGLAVALAEGKALAEAMRWGCAAGALAAAKLGAQTSLPTRLELEQLLKH